MLWISVSVWVLFLLLLQPTVRSRERPPSPPPVHATSPPGQHERVERAQEPRSLVRPTNQTPSQPVEPKLLPPAAAVQDAEAARPSPYTVSSASPAPRTYSRESPGPEGHTSDARARQKSRLHKSRAGRGEEAWRRWARPLGRLGERVAHSLARHVVWCVRVDNQAWFEHGVPTQHWPWCL